MATMAFPPEHPGPLRALAAVLVDLARDAGHGALAHHGSGEEAMRKEDDSPLTKADLASQAVLLRGLAKVARSPGALGGGGPGPFGGAPRVHPT